MFSRHNFHAALIQIQLQKLIIPSVIYRALGSITVANFSVAPKEVSVWAATTTDGYRDFRLYNCRTGAGKNQGPSFPSDAV